MDAPTSPRWRECLHRNSVEKTPAEVNMSETSSAALSPVGTFSFVLEFPAATPDEARRHFAAKLSVETDPTM
jgi:hypothetical protein